MANKTHQHYLRKQNEPCAEYQSEVKSLSI